MAIEQRAQRLCSEIQLFDLCELDSCCHKDGRFCTEAEILQRFEAIKEEDERSPEQYLTEELDEVEGDEDTELDESFGEDEYDDDDDDL